MNERQLCVLFAVVDEYVKTAQPIASRAIVEKYDLGVSPATIRNDMSALEDAGFLRQPHTSAGRVPTEEGYRLYLDQHRRAKVRQVTSALQDVSRESPDPRDLLRELAKTLVELSGETALLSIDAEWNQVTGVANLFHKPDFEDVDTMRALGEVVDRFDSVMKTVFNDIEQDINVFLGKENPFGTQMATILVKYRLPGGMTGVFGLTGPLRMNYKRNIELLREAKKLIEGDL